MISSSWTINEAAFLEIHAQTAEPLRRYVARTLGRSDGVEDIVQDVYLRALAAKGLPEDLPAARAYLFRIASNLIIDVWRRGRGRPRTDDVDQPASTGDDPGLGIDLARVFQSLSLRDRQIVWLAYVEGADHAAIAYALALSPASVRVLLHRARQRLAAALRLGGYQAFEGSR